MRDGGFQSSELGKVLRLKPIWKINRNIAHCSLPGHLKSHVRKEVVSVVLSHLSIAFYVPVLIPGAEGRATAEVNPVIALLAAVG